VPQHSDALKAAIKQAVDIVALAGGYGHDIRRAGSTYKTLCPFHDDHNPSLVLNPERQSFKCWSCGAGGDVFDFVMRRENVEFKEALRMLADRAGIALETREDRDRSAPQGPSKTDLLEVIAWAERLFAQAVRGPSAEGARAYLASRGLSQASIERFQLGYSPETRDWLMGQAHRAGFGIPLLEAAGLVKRNEDSNLTSDKFRGRLIFPIHDLRGRPIAFGGRILPEVAKKLVELGKNNAPKYLNSPETPLFKKSQHLYAADLARDAARKAGWVAVVEGYTDVIAAHQVGLANVVATLGTSFGADHITTLRRLADRVVLVYDGDEAGQNAADKSLALFLAHEVDVRVLSLPQGLDPCDFLLKEGAEPFLAMVQKASDPLDFAIARAATRYNLQSPEGARQASEWVISLVSQIPTGGGGGLDVKVAKGLDKLSQSLRVPVEDLRRSLRHQQRKPITKRVPEPETAPSVSEYMPIDESSLDPLDRELVKILLNDPSSVGQVVTRVVAKSLRDASLRAILQACYDLFREGELPEFSRVANHLDKAERALAAGLLLPPDRTPLSGRVPPPPWPLLLEQTLARFAERDRQERLRALKEDLDSTNQQAYPAEYRALFAEYYRLLSQRPDPKKTA
jgi:DNA primase